MKRFAYFLTIVLMLMLTALPASAQLFGIGAKAGLSVSTLSGDIFLSIDDNTGISPDLKYKTGFVVGGAFSKNLIPLFSLQTEILYVQKGARIKEDVNIPGLGVFSVEGNIDLDYLEIPVLLRAGLPIPGISPFVYAGPMVAINLDATMSLKAKAGPIEIDRPDMGFKDEVKNIDYGLVIGAGVQLGLPLVKLHVEARYTMGLTNINDNSEAAIDLKNRGISLMVGVTI